MTPMLGVGIWIAGSLRSGSTFGLRKLQHRDGCLKAILEAQQV